MSYLASSFCPFLSSLLPHMHFLHSRQNVPFTKYVILCHSSSKTLPITSPFPQRGRWCSLNGLKILCDMASPPTLILPLIMLPLCLTTHQSHCIPCCSSNILGMFLPQNLCTCVLSWTSLSPGISMTQILLICHLIRGAFPYTLYKKQLLPPLIHSPNVP